MCGVLGSQDSLGSEVLQQEKNSNMDRDAVKDLVYGGLQELLKDKKYYRYSDIGPTYSYLTDEGQKVVVDLVNVLGYRIRKAEEEDLDERAKRQVLDQMRGDR
jgi:hypothetical protein